MVIVAEAHYECLVTQSKSNGWVLVAEPYQRAWANIAGGRTSCFSRRWRVERTTRSRHRAPLAQYELLRLVQHNSSQIH